MLAHAVEGPVVRPIVTAPDTVEPLAGEVSDTALPLATVTVALEEPRLPPLELNALADRVCDHYETPVVCQ